MTHLCILLGAIAIVLTVLQISDCRAASVGTNSTLNETEIQSVASNDTTENTTDSASQPATNVDNTKTTATVSATVSVAATDATATKPRTRGRPKSGRPSRTRPSQAARPGTSTRGDATQVTETTNTNSKTSKPRRRPSSGRRGGRTRERESVKATPDQASKKDETTTVAPVTTFDGLECDSVFRPDPDNPQRFEEKTPDNFWLAANCPAELVWQQTLCRCEYPDKILLDTPCGEYRDHSKGDIRKFERIVQGVWQTISCNIFTDNLVWSQEKCMCDWDPNANARDKAPRMRQVRLPNSHVQCLYLLNMTFDTEVKDYASKFWIDKQWNAHIIPNHKIAGDVNGCAEIRNSPIKIEGFSGNDLTGTLRVMFRFKVHPESVDDDRYMVLISNGCKSWSGSLNRPSMALSFIPFNETFRVQFNTTAKKVVSTASAPADADGWYTVVLYLQDRLLRLKVNNQTILTEGPMNGPVVKSSCPLMIAGAPLKLDNNFDGFLDELIVVKQCKWVNGIQKAKASAVNASVPAKRRG